MHSLCSSEETGAELGSLPSARQPAPDLLLVLPRPELGGRPRGPWELRQAKVYNTLSSMVLDIWTGVGARYLHQQGARLIEMSLTL